ncbi:F0F1 ATP synthase subunit A [Oribacterium sp. oral taxon 102]|uniref:F0F1 ATP synthase subunit A n=1 Tax=Oribacterium sp. oral taxon 102 TaxID=671214 RepID=UPI0015BE1DF8|nr:F0F1 ATP synthase subunit A [Oribacterium sp. oral taxon 102]NWO20443.1 F0F1 ATP synthase subunit A [Oribacterium sp. oral taxon 102]
MQKLAAELLAELNVETVFTIPLFGGIGVSESVVISWIVMAILLAASVYLGSDLKVRNPGRRQQLAEIIVTKLDSFTDGMLGEEAKGYGSYISVVLLFIGLSNLIGIFGLKPPTKDLNVPIALSLMSIVLVEAAGIRQKGPWKWMKSFTQPIAIVTPINILEVFIRPLSLCMRLFGNVLGAFVIMELIKLVVPVGLPAILSLYFDIFDGLIQAYVFVFLTSLYIKEAVE